MRADRICTGMLWLKPMGSCSTHRDTITPLYVLSCPLMSHRLLASSIASTGHLPKRALRQLMWLLLGFFLKSLSRTSFLQFFFVIYCAAKCSDRTQPCLCDGGHVSYLVNMMTKCSHLLACDCTGVAHYTKLF